MGIPNYLLQQPRYHILALSVVLIGLLGAVAYIVKLPTCMVPLFIVPVALSAISLGFQGGLLISLVAVLTGIVLVSFENGALSQVSMAAYINAGIGFVAFVFVSMLLSGVKTAFAHQWNQARIDPLTGLLNRSYFLELASRKLGQARIQKQTLTAVRIAINNFESCMAKQGSQSADQVLQNLSASINRITRQDDLIGRVGDDVFMIILAGVGTEAAPLILDRLKQHFSTAVARCDVPLTFAIGAATFVDLPKDINALQDLMIDIAANPNHANGNVLDHRIITHAPPPVGAKVSGAPAGD